MGPGPSVLALTLFWGYARERLLFGLNYFRPSALFFVRNGDSPRHRLASRPLDDVTDPPVPGDVLKPELKHLAPEEVLEKLDSLSAEDKIRLRLIELRRLGGTDFKEGLLYQEAVCQAVLGERKCPRDESFVAFLAQSMRSVASHRRAALKKQVPMEKADGKGRWFRKDH